MFADVLFVFDELVAQELFEMRADALQARHAVHDIACEVKSIQIVQDGHVERSRRCSFLFVSADVEVVMIGAAVGQAMNQPGIPMESEHHGRVFGENGIEVAVR